MRLIESIVNDGHGYMNPNYLFIHETANPGATADNHRELYSRGWEYAVHYVSDWTGDVYHCMYDDHLAWAVGNGNPYGVSLEICHATNVEDFKKAWDTSVEFAAWYLKKRGWTINNLMSHDECRIRWGGTDHTDPIGYFNAYGKSWDAFKQEVAKRINGIPQETIKPAKKKNRRRKMECIIRPNGENRLDYIDGSDIHPLSHPDELEAIRTVYKKCYGEDIPMIELGTKKAPWASRLYDALRRKATGRTANINQSLLKN